MSQGAALLALTHTHFYVCVHKRALYNRKSERTATSAFAGAGTIWNMDRTEERINSFSKGILPRVADFAMEVTNTLTRFFGLYSLIDVFWPLSITTVLSHYFVTLLLSKINKGTADIARYCSLSPTMTIKVVHRRLLRKSSPVRCGMLPAILSVILILVTVCCVNSMPTTGLGAHCFHSYSKRTGLQQWGLSRRRQSTDKLSGAGASLSTHHKDIATSSLSVRGGSFALPHTAVTESGTQTSVDYSAGGYVVSMYTDDPLTGDGSTDIEGSRQRPYTLFSSIIGTSPVPTEPSANDDVDLPPFFQRIFGERSALLLMIPITVLKLLILI
jgi:hypothetical protein